MAKIKLGALAGQVSGSVGCYTFASGRGGAVIRLRGTQSKQTATPRSFEDNPDDPAPLRAKRIFGALSAQWRSLSETDRQSWISWAYSNPVTDTLGARRPSTGIQAFIRCNSILALMGAPAYLTPPGAPTPTPFETLVVSADIGSGFFGITFSPAPTSLTTGLCGYGTYSSGTYQIAKQHKLYLLGAGGPSMPSPLPILPGVTARLGQPVPGQWLTVRLHVIDITTGLLSTGIQSTSQIIST